jgi:hypothetical protein
VTGYVTDAVAGRAVRTQLPLRLGEENASMTYIARSFDFDQIGLAWNFVVECEDDEPRAFGYDRLVPFATRRHGVFQRCAPLMASSDDDAVDLEDALIAHLDGEVFDDEADDDCDWGAWYALGSALDDAREPIDVAPEALDTAPADPCDTLPSFEGCGRRARVAPQVSLRRFRALSPCA